MYSYDWSDNNLDSVTKLLKKLFLVYLTTLSMTTIV